MTPIEIIAHSDAKVDGYEFTKMGRVARDRYMERAKASYEALLAAGFIKDEAYIERLNNDVRRLSAYCQELREFHDAMEVARRIMKKNEGVLKALAESEQKDREG